jgi:hypothetical protein
MAISTLQWDCLSALTPGDEVTFAYLAARVGGDVAVTELFDLGHLESGGGRKLTRTKASADAFLLYESLPHDGSRRSNATARAESGLSVRRYEHAKAVLEASGEIARGRGPGGSIRRSMASDTRPSAPTERALYEPVRAALHASITGAPQFQVAAITADGAGGRKRGQWTRPDLVDLVVHDYENLPGPVLEVHSFEVKPRGTARDLRGVYEAAAHQRQAHTSSLIIEWPSTEQPPEAVQLECSRFDVGLALFSESELDWVVSPKRREPDPTDLNALVGEALNALSESDRVAYRRAIGKAE